MKKHFGLTPGHTVGKLGLFAIGALLTLGSVASAADLTVFEQENFRGRRLDVENSAPNFERFGANDRAASLTVRGGSWEVCSDAFFRGRCVTLRPGNYPSLRSMGLDKRISSAREVGWANNGPIGGGDNRPPAGGPGWGRGARAVLYEGQNLSGRAFVIDTDVMPNLDPTGFNDRASSIRIEGGYWMFCSEAEFRGACRTFGPGDYPVLDGNLSNRISSGRRVSNNYPYGQRPNWDQDRGNMGH